MSIEDDAIDAELLAMAGSDDSDDEEQVDVPQHVQEPSPSPSAVHQSVEHVEEPSTKRGVAQRVRKRGRKARKRNDSEDEDDDGIASSPEADFSEEEMLRSASAEDAPGSPDSNQDADMPLYPIEGKFTSAADREWLLSLPELEREQELEKRAQEVIHRQQDRQLKLAFASAKSRNQVKRKAEDADLEDNARKSSRPKMERGVKSALDKYKRAREQAGVDRERRDGRTTRKDERSPSEVSDRDADGESEVEWAETKSSRRDEPSAALADYNHCRVGRSNFAQICFYPGFEEAITGCFARVSVGPDGYRMALIKGFREGKPYTIENSSGKKILIDQYAVVAQGRSEKPWPFAACSDGKFTDQEMDRYLSLLHDQHLKVPTAKVLNAKVNDINLLLNRQWTDEDISAKINKQKAIEAKYNPANAGKLAREKIMKRKAQAEEESDDEEIARCNAELQALEANSTNGINGIGRSPAVGRSPAIGRSPPKSSKTSNITEQERLAQRNANTRMANAEEVRKALLAERKKELAARERAIAQAKAKAEQEAKLLHVPDPDTADLFGSDVSRAGTPVNGLKKAARTNGSRAGTPLSQTDSKRPLGALRSSQKNDDDVIAAMDLDIEIEI